MNMQLQLNQLLVSSGISRYKLTQDKEITDRELLSIDEELGTVVVADVGCMVNSGFYGISTQRRENIGIYQHKGICSGRVVIRGRAGLGKTTQWYDFLITDTLRERLDIAASDIPQVFIADDRDEDQPDEQENGAMELLEEMRIVSSKMNNIENSFNEAIDSIDAALDEIENHRTQIDELRSQLIKIID